eukprot:508209_1
MGGHHRVNIESVRIFNKHDDQWMNYEARFGALCKLNKMFNGNATGRGVSPCEKELIIDLLNWMLGDKKVADKIDGYVLDTFRSFCQHKAHIVFNYYWLCRDNDKDLLDV